MVLEDALGALHHGGIGAAKHVVGVDDDIDAPVGEFLFGELGVGGGDSHDGGVGVFLAEALAELLDVHAVLVLGMNHDAVGASLDVGEGTFEGVLDGLASDEAFDAGNNHEVAGDLRLLAGADFVAEALDGVLCLHGVGAEEGVLLEAHLVLDDDCGDAETLEGADGEDEVLDLSAGIAVVDDGLGGDLEGVVEVVEARGEVDGLDVGFTLGGGVGERGGPHAVELAGGVALLNLGVLDDEAREAAVALHDADDGLSGDEAAQALHAGFRRGAEGLDFGGETRRGDALGVGDFNHLAAELLHGGEDLVADVLVGAFQPVVAVDDIVGLVLQEVGDIAPFVLGDDLADAVDMLDDGATLFIGEVRQALVGSYRLVGEEADDHVTIFGTLVDDVDQAGVHDVGNHAEVDFLVCHVYIA